MALTKVSTDGVKDDAVTSGKIPANAVGSSEIANSAVNTLQLETNAVNSDKIATAAVTTVKIADGNVTTAKIPDGNVTAAKLASGVQTTINNNADNRVITGSGTANTLEGEANLQYDGTLKLNGLTNTAGQNSDALTVNRADGLQLFGINWNVNANEVSFSGNTKNYVFKNKSGSAESIRFPSTGGITFNGDTATANALDDYEEGTFTPTMTYNTLQQAPQGTFSGQYQKVGNCVHFQARFTLTDEGSGIDNIRLSNLPFTPNTSSFTHPMATFFAINGVNIGDPDKMIVVQLQTNQYVFYTVGISDSDNYAAFNMNQIVDSAIFGCYGHYYTSS